jgi:hypothetical protein
MQKKVPANQWSKSVRVYAHFGSAKMANTMLAKVANVNRTCAMRHFTQTHFLSIRDLTARGRVPFASLVLAQVRRLITF